MRKLFILFGLGLVLLGGFACYRAVRNPYYRGPKSDHFDGLRFYNPELNTKTIHDLLRWRFTRDPKPWPKHPAFQIFDIPPKKVSVDGLRATFVGQSTVLIQSAGLNILTDPIWSERSSPFSWFGPKRIPKPGIAWKDLPKIDAVLISHTHYDHLDLPTVSRLFSRDNPVFLVGLGVDTILRNEFSGIRVEALDWGDDYILAENFRIMFRRMQHWSARGLLDRRQTLWGAFVIKAPGGNIYFAGDAGYSKDFRETSEEFESFRLAILPIGSYEPRSFMTYGHMNPGEAVQAHLDLNAEQSLGVHWGTFPLADEDYEEPPEKLAEALSRRGVAANTFLALRPGEVWELRDDSLTKNLH